MAVCKDTHNNLLETMLFISMVDLQKVGIIINLDYLTWKEIYHHTKPMRS